MIFIAAHIECVWEILFPSHQQKQCEMADVFLKRAGSIRSWMELPAVI